MNDWTPPIIVGRSTRPVDAGDNAFFRRLGVASHPSASVDAWILQRDDSALSLIRPDGVSLCIDFLRGKARHRSTEAGKGAQTLNKALGIKAYYRAHGRYPDLVDATGGLGQDAWAIASLGCTVTVIEQHAIVHALLADALHRAVQAESGRETAARIQLVHANSENAMNGLNAHAIYLDPMYPTRPRKKAESKKGMQFLQTLLGPVAHSNAGTLLNQALALPVTRVVLKRPKGAEVLVSDGSAGIQRITIESPNTRYDVYLP